ncbi:ABC transporter permease [Limibacillus halophilus]|uniref:Peptide/nickel transport system permease protein n=1 Tax=Limibacillus halophilus TaxID=1579333 RepID=A0A839SPZ3_9PROT|nr:ABC transporter permease [Limibacillus halophilus]MBB3064522.1 peptide/nickel transport system permease protein [Limibacillus halophilus]
MFAFILRRTLAAIPVVVLVSVMVFSLMRMLPGDVIDLIIGQAQADVSEETIAALRKQYGLDEPIYLQYITWISKVMVGDFGYSLRSYQPVIDIILPRLVPTLQIGLLALVFSTLIAVPLGALSAVRPNSIWDRLGTAGTFIGASTPYFLAGGLLIYLVSLKAGWLPPSGFVPLTEDFSESLKRSIMPALTIALSLTAILLRQTRASFKDVIELPYIRTAYAKGLSPTMVMIQHAMKNAMLPIVTILGLQLGMVFSGAVITETVFAIPGVGRLLVDSILGRDYPIVQALVLLIAVAVVLATLFVDIVYGLLDPRSSRA